MIKLITPAILSFNEAPNLRRTLSKLSCFESLLLLDSFSTDETLQIAQTFPHVEIVQHRFESFGSQWNFALTKISTPWVLSLDADYVLTDELITELSLLEDKHDVDAYAIRFRYCVFGNPLPGSLLPPRVALFRKQSAQFTDDGHRQLLMVNGNIANLHGYIDHDDRKSLARWLNSQTKYMVLETAKLESCPDRDLNFADRLRKMRILAPFIVLFYCLFIRGCLFAGWAGWYYTLQRVLAEILLSLYLIEHQQMRVAGDADKSRQRML